ncbi:hypothetical protein N9C96_01055 [bacterium]|nr:hypothetical protein [bacterium]
MTIKFLTIAALCCAGLATTAAAQDADTSFFITSENPGDGGNLGGLAGADAHCTALAEAAGVTGKVWAAYLSSSTENARDRIGAGPWTNANGVVVAESVDNLHDAANNNLNKETSISESGAVINGRGDEPNRHDILTGSSADGMFVGPACEDWTSASADSSAMVGHHDRTGGGSDPTSWGTAHPSRGCSLENLRGTGGDGLFYCFAVN